MRFRVVGADRATGAERELILDAHSRDAACDEANRLGLLVADCTHTEAASARPSARAAPAMATCAGCGAVAQLSPDKRRGRCGKCGKVFTAVADSAAVPAMADTKDATK